jgi:hypothetical protein
MRYRRLSARNTRANIRGKRAQCTGGPPTLPVPIFCGTRSLTAPAPGNMSATTPMKQSRPASESGRTSILLMQTVGVVQGLRLGKQASAAARFSPSILGNDNVRVQECHCAAIHLSQYLPSRTNLCSRGGRRCGASSIRPPQVQSLGRNIALHRQIGTAAG